MTQRALVQRGSASARDSGNPGPLAWATHIASLPCWLYSSIGREAVDPERTTVVEDIRLLVPTGTDITERDRVNGIVNRLGESVLEDVMNIRSVLLKRDHLEVLLTRVTA
jgi:hypothetical protein